MLKKILCNIDFNNIKVLEIDYNLIEYYNIEEQEVLYYYIDILTEYESMKFLITIQLRVKEYDISIFDIEYDIIFVSLYNNKKEFINNLYDMSIKEILEEKNIEY